ncbi:aldehyde dehydrogenase family protein [Caenispirillum bisanense]|uniref:aldehyde dehydrogenase family protein n=1 Tax=Caenispirillum bisanense TaxID=414052 RepID=UPI0031DECCFA
MTAEPLTTLSVVSPVDGSVYIERPLADEQQIAEALTLARLACDRWGRESVTERVAVAARLLDRVKGGYARIAESLAWQVGTPLAQAEQELRDAEDLARTMMGLGPHALADIHGPEEPGVERFVRRVPHGVVFVTLPWAQPWLVALTVMLPALLAGNALVVRPSPQAPLAAEVIAKAFRESGLPKDVVQTLHLSEADAARVAGAVEVDMVIHAGEPDMTRWLVAAVSARSRPIEIVGAGLDAAFAPRDPTLPAAPPAIAGAAFRDAGRGYGAVKRLYVHAEAHDPLVDMLGDAARALVLGSPLKPDTTLGPVARLSEAVTLRQRLLQATTRGATEAVDPALFLRDDGAGLYVAPRVVVLGDAPAAGLDLLEEPTPGPVVTVVRVGSDEEAASLINDGAYGRSAALWTQDAREAARIAHGLRVGAVFQNQCGVLDGNLVWTGTSASGGGVLLSRAFYERVTRPMTLNLLHKA